jgi:Family of unknown function (DUF6011)
MESNRNGAAGGRVHCLRCGRVLTAAASVSRGLGRTCRARIAAAAQVADLSEFHGWQVDKAREAIEQGAVVPSSRQGLYAAVASDGVLTYLVDAHERSCTCRAAANGHRCYHLADALILDAASIARRAA